MQPGIVTSDHLRRMKCPICGSRDKNTSETCNDAGEPVIKVLACNQCGHLTMFGIAAAVVTDILAGNGVGRVEYYDTLVHRQHEGNHPD